jgi:hypothetical protein
LAARKANEEWTMKDASTYRQYAAECRRIAQTMSGEDRSILLQMAGAWDASAQEAGRIEARRGDKPDDLK